MAIKIHKEEVHEHKEKTFPAGKTFAEPLTLNVGRGCST